jgi:hypothetical protein
LVTTRAGVCPLKKAAVETINKAEVLPVRGGIHDLVFDEVVLAT